MNTVNDLIVKWKVTASSNREYTQVLWRSAAQDIVNILENNPPDEAVAKLRKIRRTYRTMAISMWYSAAAHELSRILRKQKASKS